MQSEECRVNYAEGAFSFNGSLSCGHLSEALVTSIKKIPLPVRNNTRKFQTGMQYRPKKF